MGENSPVSAIEDIEAALNEAPICEYPDFTNAVREVLALARRAEALKREIAELREALDKIERAPAWGAPDRWETTPAEVRQIARAALKGEPA